MKPLVSGGGHGVSSQADKSPVSIDPTLLALSLSSKYYRQYYRHSLIKLAWCAEHDQDGQEQR